MGTAHTRPRAAESDARLDASTERTAIAHVAGLLKPTELREGRHALTIVDDRGHSAVVPPALADLMADAAALMAEGHPVTLVSPSYMLTTQEAADLLNVSRQYTVRLIDRGDLPAIKVGRHRRLRLGDVQAYKVRRDAVCDAALDELVALSEEANGYALAR